MLHLGSSSVELLRFHRSGSGQRKSTLELWYVHEMELISYMYVCVFQRIYAIDKG